MSQPRRHGAERPRRQKTGAGGHSSVRLAEVQNSRKPGLAGMVGYAGYMLGAWLMTLTMNSFSSTPIVGFVWSPAILGTILILATALIMDDRGIRTRLKIFDEASVGKLTYSLAWGALGLVAILAITTWPMY